MIEKIFDKLYIDNSFGDERFCVILTPEELLYDRSPKTDYHIFNIQDYTKKITSKGQKYFTFYCISLEEYLEILHFFVTHGYAKRIKYNSLNLQNYHGGQITKKWWTLEEIKELGEEKFLWEGISGWLNYNMYFKIEILIDLNKLEDFRKTLKNLPDEYKVMWLYKDNLSCELPTFILK